MIIIQARDRIHVTDRAMLKQLIADAMKTSGPQCSLNHLDVSGITDMSGLFFHSDFNGDISKWDVLNVTNMSGMFYRSLFEDGLSRWDVSKVTDFSGMFQCSSFYGDISGWNTSNAADMSFMFQESPFDGNVGEWDVSKVVDVRGIFTDCKVNHHLSKWRLPMLETTSRSFSAFNDSVLGYLDVLNGYYDFPEHHPRAAQFHQLRALTTSLDLSPLGAARLIYESMHPLISSIPCTPESFTDFQMGA